MSTRFVVALANKLANQPEVRVFDSNGEREADRIAYGLADIVGSAEKLESIAKSIVELKSPEQVGVELVGLYEELNHISYHLRDMHSFKDFERK